jgi:hypothetical protein
MNMCAAWLVALVASTSCSSSSSGPVPSNGPVGQKCTTAAQCYGGIDAGALTGQATCLTQVNGGYCTHTCTTDADCCAVPGECPDGRPEVCGPFESAADMYCLLSCENADLADAGVVDANTYCTTYGSAAFTCRSSGGGTANRKICAP